MPPASPFRVKSLLSSPTIPLQRILSHINKAGHGLTKSTTGDTLILVSARHQARSSFAKNRSLLPSSPEASTQIAHAEDVAKILRQNVVQGQKVKGEEQGGKYSELFKDESLSQIYLPIVLELRIHEETERGDNDSVKINSKSISSASTGCCGG